MHFIDGILNAQRYRDEILRPIVVPFIHDHHLMLQHDNAWPHVARICTQFLEAENIPVLAWPAYSPDMSPIEHVWDALDRRIQQHVPVPANIQQLRTAKLNTQKHSCFWIIHFPRKIKLIYTLTITCCFPNPSRVSSAISHQSFRILRH